ncbi:MAG: hypothetical protein ACSNEK_02090 [Parachlamydiaceae bacterium]
MKSALGRFQEWYQSEKDEYDTLDNPGWSLDVRLAETKLKLSLLKSINR